MENVRKLKRGEVLFKEGDAPVSVYMIQSGKIGLMVERGGSHIEVASLGTSHVLGESAMFTSGKQAFTAEALQETKVLEVPLDLMKAQFEKTPPGIKLMVKSLSDDMRAARQQAKVQKLETEKSPMPQGVIHRYFTLTHLISRHIGKKDPAQENQITVSFGSLKLYASRFFGESPQRLRSLMDLLSKVHLAELKIGKNDEGHEELQDVKLTNVQLVEDFAEFFQHHLFKGGRSESIAVDPLALKVCKAMVEISAVAEVDHKGASKLDYGALLNECKTKYHFELKNTHFDLLEKKGLFVKRQSFDDGRITLSFDRPEFAKTAQYWAIIHEIDKWNEKGTVDLNEAVAATGTTGMECPQCKAPTADQHKFCPSCGHKLAA